MSRNYSVKTTFKAVDQMSRVVKKMHSNVSKFTSDASKKFNNINRKLNRFGQGAKKAFQVAAVGVGLFAAAMGNVINTGAQFEQQFINAAAKFGTETINNTELMKALEAQARNVGRTTEFTATQAAEGLNFLAMAGFNAEQSIAALPRTVDLATAAQVDLGTATDIATDSLGAFNLMTDDTIQLEKNLARVNDVLAKTATSTNTTIELMFEAIKEGGPVATAAGASVEEFAALTGKLADSGIKGTRAGTTLKNMFVRLSAPSAQAIKLLKKMNVQTKDSEGNLLSMTKILGQLNKGLDGIGTADRAAVLNEIFGRIPIAGVNVLLAEGEQSLRNYTETLEGATGASQKMAKTMRGSFLNSLKELNSAIESVKITIFSTTKGPLNDMVKGLTQWIRENEKLIATNIAEFIFKVLEGIKYLVENGEGILKVTTFVFGLVAAFKILAGILTLINLIVAANPITLLVIGIISAIGLLIAHWDTVTDFFSSMWDGMISGISSAIDWLVDLASTVMDFFLAPFEATANFVSNLIGGDDDETESRASSDAQIMTPSEIIARKIEERNQLTRNEIVINDKSGRAEVEDGPLPSGIILQSSGGF